MILMSAYYLSATYGEELLMALCDLLAGLAFHDGPQKIPHPV